MKLCVFFLFKICPWIILVGDWALRWTEGNEAVQIAFVMLIFPVIMNGIQYYIIDSFIKNKEDTPEHDLLTAEDGDEEEGQHLRDNWDVSFETDDEDDDPKKTPESESRTDSSSQVRVTPDKMDDPRMKGGDENQSLIANRK